MNSTFWDSTGAAGICGGAHTREPKLRLIDMHFCRHRLLPILLLTLPLGVYSQVPTPQAPAPTHKTSPPYTGDLGIFEEPGRDLRLQINRVMDLLHIVPGANVADIGAGGGWFSVRAAKRVGPAGRVYAEDINQRYVEAIQARAAREHLGNITTVLGTQDDPKLPEKSVDAVLLLKVYHEIAWPPPLLIGLKSAMRSGAKLGIIDRNGNGYDHGLDEKIAREEIEKAGFKQVGRYDFTKADGQDYFLIFEKK